MSASCIVLLAVALASQTPAAPPDSPGAGLEAAAPCVTSSSTSPLYSPPAYQIEPDGNVPSGVVAAAEAAWDSSGCNTNGTAFPLLTPNAVSGSKPVTVTYVEGLNPDNNRSCGQTTPQGPSAYAITLYSQARGESGAIGSCGSTAALTQSLEHELGHMLNLADSNCPGYIMSQVAFPPQTGPIPPQPATRTIQPAECAEANKMNITPAEQPPPPPPPTQCPPTCACPPICETGCDANGVCKDNPCTTDPTLPQCNGDGAPGEPCDADDPCDDGGIITAPPPSLLPPTLRLRGSQDARRWRSKAACS